MDIQNAPTFSNGWYEAFCKRNGFQKFTQHGESGSAPIDSPEVQVAVAAIKLELMNYQQRDIYNMDETGLYYNMEPDYTIACHRLG